MIKNIVFDIGNVIIDYSPQRLVSGFGLNEAESKQFFENVFASEIWFQLDKGVYSIAEAVEIINKQIPQYAELVKRTFTDESLEILFNEKLDTLEFMRELKEKGYKTFLLSNFSREGFDFVLKRFEFPHEVDGMIISSHVGINKPDRGIYECLLDKYSLKASETVFLDDLEQNCKGAERLGIRAIQFLNLEDAKSELDNIINESNEE